MKLFLDGGLTSNSEERGIYFKGEKVCESSSGFATGNEVF
jgi:hypothetical protein